MQLKVVVQSPYDVAGVLINQYNYGRYVPLSPSSLLRTLHVSESGPAPHSPTYAMHTQSRPSSSLVSSSPSGPRRRYAPPPESSCCPAPHHLSAPQARVALTLPPHRGSCQNEDGFLSREGHVGVRLHQSLHSR